MGGRALLIMIVGIIVISMTIFANITEHSKTMTTNADRNYYRIQTRNIAQSGANLALRQIEKDQFWTAGFSALKMMDGVVTVTVTNGTYKGAPVIKITSVGTMDGGDVDERKDTSVVYFSRGYVPGAVRAAVTTTHLASAQGNVIVDGNDHYASGALVGGGQGTLGIWTLEKFQQGGASKLGGVYNGVSYSPASNPNANIIAQNQTFPGGYPNDPDLVMGGASNGYPPGTMMAVAKSGLAGSQYVTNPKNLKSPLRGVTYVDLPPGKNQWVGDITGSGILIVHSTTGDAILENPHGSFTGMVMADEIVHIQAVIIGCALSMGGSEDDIINGPGTILYSREAIANGSKIASGNSALGGWAGNVVAWWE